MNVLILDARQALLVLYVQYTDQMQGIRQTRFDRMLNMFSASDECV